MHDAAVLCMLLLILFPGTDGRSSKLSNSYLCVYTGTYLGQQSGSGKGCCNGGVGRLLELKLGAVYCERTLLHP